MGLFEDIGSAIKTEQGIKALSGIVAAITSPEGYKAQAGYAATQEVGKVQQLAKENQQKQDLLNLDQMKEQNSKFFNEKNLGLKSRELDIDETYKKGYLKILGQNANTNETKANKPAVSASKSLGEMPDVFKKDIETTMKSLDKKGFEAPDQREDFMNALVASKYGAKTPVRTDFFTLGGRIQYRPKLDTYSAQDGTQLKLKVGQTRTNSQGQLTIYVGPGDNKLPQWVVIK
jgi:hypothetical protein